MKDKYLNDTIIGNNRMLISFSDHGELLRLFYPTRDYRQFLESFKTGVKINDSRLISLHDDVNNHYQQYYTPATNILNTEIMNTYFNLRVLQTDCVTLENDVLIKKYKFINQNAHALDVHFLIYSNLFSSFNNVVGSKVEKNYLLQYSHSYIMSIFSKEPIEGYRLNNSSYDMQSGIVYDKDYIGMARDTAISYYIGNLQPQEEKEIVIFLKIHHCTKENTFDKVESELQKIKEMNVQEEILRTQRHWENYVLKHDKIGLFNQGKEEGWLEILGTKEHLNQTKRIYERSILLFPLLMNHDTGGISAAIEVDENKDKCGRYSYCWPRDGVFTARALDLLMMHEETTKFYTEFAKRTQSQNGMWEQRFYTDGRLAPCWGYQIDETASIVYGVYEHYKVIKSKKFLLETLEMCQKAVEFLKKYINYIECGNKTEENEIFERAESYDLWEMHQGIHLYSLAAIYSAFKAMAKIYAQLDNAKEYESEIKILKEYAQRVKEFCEINLVEPETRVLKRSNQDNISDISVLGAITPFKMFKMGDKEVKNTIERINLTLRTYTGGYLRFSGDSYLGGENPWPIATLWMAIYYMIQGNLKETKKLIDFVNETATKQGFLAEQVDNQTMTSKWVIGLAWSHAMYVIVISIYSFFKFGHF